MALFTVIAVSFIDQLHLCREPVRQAVAAQLADGALAPGEFANIERYGERLGMSPDDATATIEYTAQQMSEATVCRHCGWILTGTRSVAAPTLAPSPSPS